jgi:hypothetical protein
MLTPSYLKVYDYPIKKIEIFEAETGEHRHPKNIHYIAVHPIEANYTLVLGGYDEGLPLPLKNVYDIKAISTNGIEFNFVGTGTIGTNNMKYVARIKTDEKYANQVFELIKNLKELENSSSYWERESLTFQTSSGLEKTVEIYSQTPFLAEGEQIIWQNLKSEFIDNKRKVNSIDVVTNFRIFQYDYLEHKGTAILFPFLGDVKVTDQQKTMTSPIGTYSNFSNKLTGVKNVRTNNIIGNIVFYDRESPLISFKQITDPETLSIVVRTVKQQYESMSASSLNDGSKDTNKTESQYGAENIKINLNCTRCAGVSSPGSKFCSKCGFALTSVSLILDSSDHVEERIIQDPEQHKIERFQNLRQRIVEYKPTWDKDGIIQYKTEYIAILQRRWGMQVEFIIAFDDLTREGYRLMAVDEGKTGGQSSGGFTGGVNAYFYFQNMKYVK